MERSANETQAMIKFSHADLYRRMTTLEEEEERLKRALESLEIRVTRLESGTQ